MWHARASALPLLLLAAAGGAQAATVTSTWIGGTGDWGVAGNWSPATVPNNGADSFDVRIDNGATATNSSVNLNIDASIRSLRVDSGDSLSIAAGRSLTLSNTAVSVNNGMIGVTAAGTGSLIGAPAALDNTGTLQASGGGIFKLDSLSLNNAGGTIRAQDGSEVQLLGSTSVREGTLATSGTGVIRLLDSTSLRSLNNTGLFVLNNDTLANIREGIGSSASDVVTNSGTMAATSGAAEIRVNSLAVLANTGTVKADNATLNLVGNGGGVNNSGTLLATAGGTLRLDTLSLDNTGGTVKAQNGSEVQLVNNTSLREGTLATEGTGAIRLLDTTSLRSLSNTGLFVLNDSALANIREGLGSSASDVVTNSGTMAATSGSAEIRANSLAVLANTGTIKADNATLNLVGNGGGVNNAGTLLATSSGTLKLDTLSLDNTGGTVKAQNGSEVQIVNNTTIREGTLATEGTGVIRVLDTTSLRSLNNTGLLVLNNGTLANISQGIGSSASDTVTNSGTMAATSGAAEIRVNDLALLANAGTVKADNATLNLVGNGGGVDNSGTLLATAGGTLKLNTLVLDNTGGTVKAQNGSEVQLVGTTSIREGTLATEGNGVIRLVNNTSFRSLTNSGLLVLGNGTTATIRDGLGSAASDTVTNTGTMAVTTGTGTISVTSGSTLANSGTLRVDAGATLNLTVAGSISHTGGTLLVNGTLASAQAINLQGGTLLGGGVLDADLVNSGQINPGNSPGILTIDGNYTQAADGILTIQIGGLLAGLEFDQLQVTGTAALAGTLDIDLIGGFVPLADASFDILLANAVSGGFSILDLPTTANGTWDVAYLGNLVRLTFDFDETGGNQVPEPAGLALILAGLGLFGCRRKR